MYDSKAMLIIFKIKQLGFDSQTVDNVKKYFDNSLNSDAKEETKALVSFVNDILVTH